MRYVIIAGVGPNKVQSPAAPGKFVAWVGTRHAPKFAFGYQRTGDTKREACDRLSAALSARYPKHTFVVEPDTLDDAPADAPVVEAAPVVESRPVEFDAARMLRRAAVLTDRGQFTEARAEAYAAIARLDGLPVPGDR